MSDFESIIKRIESKNDELKKVRADFMDAMKLEFRESLRFFFEETGIQAVSWAQYTPYFNDGEECVFRINDCYFVKSGYDPESDDFEEVYSPYDFEDDQYEILEYGDRSSPLGEQCRAFERLINRNQDMMRELFGDHVVVILTKDGSKTHEYDHE